ncbi:seipin isoform X2 [Cimex lectularius]|uniref:Seipin n=1 Tax=Cimex lectularius TaxID=79782 RepID=A0A8I6SFC8_CIMLE|nr:seipin isoform X2 [Cimex lectularius]
MLGFSFLIRRYEALKKRTVDTTNNTLETALRFSLLLLSVFTVVWLSVFLYVAFYYTYVPNIEHIKPVNLAFQACEAEKKEVNSAVCSFPKAHVLLTKSNSLLMVGQPYKITVFLEVPESDENRSVGMFLVCGELYSQKGVTVAHSCRSTMLRYRSPLLKALRMLALSGFYIFNILEEKQTLEVELFSNFEEDQNYPITDMHVEIRTERIQVYSSKVRIDAHLTGLRYLMFHWPMTSTILGVVFNMIVILFIIMLSWWHLYGPYNITGDDFSLVKLKEKLIEKKEETEGLCKPRFLNLQEEFEEEEGEERKYFLERKASSSEA